MGLYHWLFDSSTTLPAAKRRRGRPRTTPMMSCERRAAAEGTRHVAPSINKPTAAKSIYIDGEWNSLTKPQKFYLLGYCFDEHHAGWLYDENDYTYMGKTLYHLPYRGKNLLTRKYVLELFRGVDNIYFYGPDIGMLEKCFHIDLCHHYNCINLLSATKQLEPAPRRTSWWRTNIRQASIGRRRGISTTQFSMYTVIGTPTRNTVRAYCYTTGRMSSTCSG